jgi:DNA-binding transcriptional ArsR family regulator
MLWIDIRMTMGQRSDVHRVERRMLAALTAVLPRSAPVEVVAADGSYTVVRLGRRRLALHWVGRAGVREVRDVLGLRDRPDIIVGSELSLAARAAAGEAGLGWVDETGGAEIVADDIVVSRSGRPERARTRPKVWTPSVLGVAEAILCGATPTVAAIAEATGHSQSSAAHALSVLTGMGLLDAEARRGQRSGRRVIDADRLLGEYAQAAGRVTAKAQLQCGVAWRDPLVSLERIGQRWDQAGAEWAVTGAVGAAVLAPYLTDVGGGEVYVEATGRPDLLAMAREADIEPMDGGRLLLRPFPTAASRRLATRQDGLRVAPWPRVYADLRLVGVRGEEAAEHLREVVHGR